MWQTGKIARFGRSHRGGGKYVAGLPLTRGTNDGMGGYARVSGPSGVAVDGAGNVYVTDFVSLGGAPRFDRSPRAGS